MIKVTYDPINGMAVPDGRAESWVKEVMETNGTDFHAIVGTEVMVNVFRLLVLEQKIKPEELVFIFGDVEIPVDKFGALKFWPKGMTILDDQLQKLANW